MPRVGEFIRAQAPLRDVVALGLREYRVGGKEMNEFQGVLLVRFENGGASGLVCGRPAQRTSDQAQRKLPTDRIAKEVFYIPAVLLLGLIVFLQKRRRRDQPGSGASEAPA